MGGETEIREEEIDNDNNNQNDVRGDNNDGMADRPQAPIQPMNGPPGGGGNNTGLPGSGGNNAGLPGARGGNNGLLENDGDELAGLEGTGSESDDDDDDDDDDGAPISTVGSSSSTAGETSDPLSQEEAPLLPDNEQPHKPKRGSKEWREERKQKREVKKAEKAGKKAEKKEEKAKKKAEKKAKKVRDKVEKQKPSEYLGLLDALNMEVAAAAANAGVGEQEVDQPDADPNRAFDTLKDLSVLHVSEETFFPKENISKNEKDLLELKEKVYKTRKEGKLYRAVIHLKMMDEGKEPASEEKALQKKGGGKAPNRFSRFMNSSKVKGAGHLMDQAGQIAKITGGVTGVASYFDAGFKASKTNSIAGMITSVVTGLNSIRGLIKKVVTLIKGRKKLKIKEKIFLVIGLASDLATAVSKAAGLAKAIETYVGRGEGLVAKAADKVATISGMVGQMGGLTAQLNSLYELRKDIDKAEAIEDAQAIEAEKAMAKYPDEGGDFVQTALPAGGHPAPGNDGEAPLPDDVANSDVADSDVDDHDVDNHDVENSDNGPDNHLANVNVEAEEEEQELPPAGKKKTLRERIRARRLKRKEKKEEKKGKKEETKGKKEEEKKEKKKKAGEGGSLQRKQFAKRAASFVQREDVSDEGKEPVILFLGFRRVRKKKTGTAWIGLSNFASTVLGLGSSALKTASLYNENDDNLKDLSGKAGLASSVGLLGSSIANHFIKKSMGDKGDTGKQEETGMIKNRLYGMVKGVADDNKYGLRKAAAALEGKPTAEKQKEVTSIMKRYEDVDKNLQGMGVNYDSLLQANNRDAFKDALIAGM